MSSTTALLLRRRFTAAIVEFYAGTRIGVTPEPVCLHEIDPAFFSVLGGGDNESAEVIRGRMGRGHSRAVIASSVQGWVLPHLIAWVESRNVNAAPIRRLFGRTKLEDPNTRVPEAVTETAWRLAATLTRDEALGIHLAESLPRGALDLIEYALRSSPSLENGLDRLARYGRLLSDRVAARTHRKGESLLFLVHDTATTPLHPARSGVCAGGRAQAGA